MSESKKKAAPKKSETNPKKEAPKKEEPKKETPKSSSSFSEGKEALRKTYATAVKADPRQNLALKAQYLKALSDLKAKHHK